MPGVYKTNPWNFPELADYPFWPFHDIDFWHLGNITYEVGVKEEGFPVGVHFHQDNLAHIRARDAFLCSGILMSPATYNCGPRAWGFFLEHIESLRPSSGIQSDTLLIKLIKELNRGPLWSKETKEMATEYEDGWSESDQIERLTPAIKVIATKIGLLDKCSEMWLLVKKSEEVSRALSKRTRGHARHAINVFWFGYYLINHIDLKDIFIQFSAGLISSRINMDPVVKLDKLETFNNMWFLAGLFHDIGVAIEKQLKIKEFQELLFEKFPEILLPIGEIAIEPKNELPPNIIKLLSQIENKDLIEDILLKRIKDSKPDHGMVAADYLSRSLNESCEGIYCAEAARAMIFHNITDKFGEIVPSTFNWEKEPLACLLLLCDQIQTWDRERGDQKLSDNDRPIRAELVKLDINTDGDKPYIEIEIDYIVGQHVIKYNYIYKRVRNYLKEILIDKPIKAIDKIQGDWPFKVSMRFTLGRNEIEKFEFG